MTESDKPQEEQPAQTMKFFKCPTCGSEKRIIGDVVKEEIAKGNLKEGSAAACMVSNTTVFDPAHIAIIAPRKVPVIQLFFDVCADCGNLYCIQMSRQEGQANPQVRRDNFQRRP